MKSDKNFREQRKRLVIPLGTNSRIFIQEYLIGKEIEILDNTNDHNYGEIGEIITLSSRDIYVNSSSIDHGIPGGNSMHNDSFRVIIEETKEDITKTILSYKKSIEDFENHIVSEENKLLFLKVSGAETYDIDEHNVYGRINEINNSKLSDYEKSKLIIEITK